MQKYDFFFQHNYNEIYLKGINISFLLHIKQ